MANPGGESYVRLLQLHPLQHPLPSDSGWRRRLCSCGSPDPHGLGRCPQCLLTARAASTRDDDRLVIDIALSSTEYDDKEVRLAATHYLSDPLGASDRSLTEWAALAVTWQPGESAPGPAECRSHEPGVLNIGIHIQRDTFDV